MALTDSNTYVEPTAGTALNTARGQQNQSYRSLLTNFRSSSPPVGTNITFSGVAEGEQTGMLFHMANNNVNALYISDQALIAESSKTSVISGTNFTRLGIGHRNENGIASLMANVTHYELGELVTTASDDVALRANGRLYLNTGAAGNEFTDIGIPPTNGSVTNTMIAINGITADRLNFTYSTEDGQNGENAHVKVSSSDGNNTAIGLGTSNTTSNVAIVKLHGGLAHKAGISIFDQTGAKYAPIAANIIAQSTIQGTDTDVAPLVPAGTIMIWGGETAVPSGWLECAGAEISRTTYAALFAAVGTSYGTPGDAANFLLPDLGDRIPIGKGTNNGNIGTSIGSLSASSKLTTDSGSAAFTLTTTDASVGAKDAGGTTVVTGVTSTGHTHTATLPSVTIRYIIKT